MGKKNKQHQILKKDNKSSSARYVEPHKLYVAPIPPSDNLEAYNNVFPGVAERIIKMTEEQSSHCQHIEKIVMQLDALNSKYGIFAGIGVAFGLMILSGIIACLGHPVESVSLAGGTIVSLAGVFVYGTRSRRKERIIKYRDSQANHPGKNLQYK